MAKENGLMSPSILVNMMFECEEKGMKMWAKEYDFQPTPSMRLGSFVDALSRGTEFYKQYLNEHPEMTKKDGTLKAEYTKALADWNDVCKKDAYFMSYMEGLEQQKELVGEIFGVKFHGYPDFMDDKKIVDLKYTKDVMPIGNKSWARARYHHYRMWLYQEMAYQMDGIKRDCYLAALTKQEPYDHEIIRLDDFVLDEAKEEIEKYMPRLQAIINGEIEPIRCNHCDYCRGSKVLTEPIDSESIGIVSYE